MEKTPTVTLPPHTTHTMARTKMQSPPTGDVLSQLAHFLGKTSYRSALDALLAEAREHNVDGVSAASWDSNASLENMWQLWKDQKGAFPKSTVAAAPKKESKKQSKEAKSEDSSDDSDSDDDDETEGKKAGMVDDEAESTSDDSSGEDSDDEEKKVEPAGTKRKREATPESSSEESSGADSGSDSSNGFSDDEAAPPTKRTKTQAKDDSSSDGSSDDSRDDSSSASDAVGAVDVDMDSSSESSSSSDSESDSESDSDSNDDSSSESAESDDSSDSSSSSDSDSESSPPPKRKVKKAASPEKKSAPAEVKPKNTKKTKEAKPTIQPVENDSAASSVTLPPNSPIKEDLVVPTSALATLDPSAAETTDPNTGIHPDRLRRMPNTAPAPPTTTTVPATAENVAKLKNSNVPFSRIPKDTYVDPKFASNEYVSYDYADRAHRDLIVTKGKGFTKEKNKKKRGAYRGGAIDLTPKGIKFDD